MSPSAWPSRAARPWPARPPPPPAQCAGTSATSARTPAHRGHLARHGGAAAGQPEGRRCAAWRASSPPRCASARPSASPPCAAPTIAPTRRARAAQRAGCAPRRPHLVLSAGPARPCRACSPSCAPPGTRGCAAARPRPWWRSRAAAPASLRCTSSAWPPDRSLAGQRRTSRARTARPQRRRPRLSGGSQLAAGLAISSRQPRTPGSTNLSDRRRDFSST